MARRWMKSRRRDTLVCPSCHTELKHPSTGTTTDYSFLCQSCQQTIIISPSPSSPTSTVRGRSPSSSTPGSPRPGSFRSLAPSTTAPFRPSTASSFRSYNSGSTNSLGASPTQSSVRLSTANSVRSYNSGPTTNSFGPSPTPSIRINDAPKAGEVRNRDGQTVDEREGGEEEENLTLAEEVVMGNVPARVWRARQVATGRDPVDVVRRHWAEMMARSAREMQDETEKMKEAEKKVAKERGIRRANATRRGG